MNTVTAFELLLLAIGLATVTVGFVSRRMADRRRSLEQRRVREFARRQSLLAASTVGTIQAWRPGRRPALATLPVGPGAEGHAAARRLLDDAERHGRAA